MIPKEKVEELVHAHAQLDEKMTGAIWIRPNDSEVWLIEIIPSMADDNEADEPTFFRPGVKFRFPLALIAGNRQSLEAALRRKPDLARNIANGEVISGADEDAGALVELARSLSQPH